MAGMLIRCLWQIQIEGSLTAFASSVEATRVAMALAQGRGFADAYFHSSGPTAHVLPVNPLLAGSVMALFGIGSAASNPRFCFCRWRRSASLMSCWCACSTASASIRRGALESAGPVHVPVFVQREVVDFRFWERRAALGLTAASLAMIAGRTPSDPLGNAVKIKAFCSPA